MAPTPSHLPVSSPAQSVPIGVPMITYGSGNGQQGFAGQGAADGHFETVGFGAGTRSLGAHGVSMNFSGPVHVHVDNMYMYDGEQLRRAIQLTHARALENGLTAPPAQQAIQAATPAKAPRKRNPPKKKASESDPANVTITENDNGNGGDSPTHASD